MSIHDLWPGRSRLLSDESFSSWFARAAAANGLRPVELYRVLQLGGDRNPRDLDRYADAHLVHRLADCTGREADFLAQATFRRWSGRLAATLKGIKGRFIATNLDVPVVREAFAAASCCPSKRPTPPRAKAAPRRSAS